MALFTFKTTSRKMHKIKKNTNQQLTLENINSKRIYIKYLTEDNIMLYKYMQYTFGTFNTMKELYLLLEIYAWIIFL